MERYFNITGCCNPQEHYMVNLDSRLARIKDMVDKGQYQSRTAVWENYTFGCIAKLSAK